MIRARHASPAPAPARRRTIRWRFFRQTAALATTTALLAASAVAAQAAPADVSEADGTFLGGTVAGIDLDTIVELEGARTENPSGVNPLDTNPLAAEVFSSLSIDLTDSLQLLGDNGIMQIGAVNQYAEANSDGSARAASGAVSDQGAISLGGSAEFPSDASIDLSGLVDAGSAGAVSQLSLTLGALSATADGTPESVYTGDYQIADADVTTTSPLVSGVYTELEDQVALLQGSLDTLSADVTSALDGLVNINLGLVQSTGSVSFTPPDLTAALPTGYVGDGAVQVNLQSGEVLVDLEQLLADDPTLPDLNDLPVNYEILNGDVVAAISAAVTSTVTSIIADVAADVRAAVEAAELDVEIAFQARLTPISEWTDVLGIDLAAPLSAIQNGSATADVTTVPGTEVLLDVLLGALGFGSTDEVATAVVNAVLLPVGAVFAVLEGLEGTLDTITSGLAAEVVDPILGVLTNVVSLTGNVQEQPGDLGTGANGSESFTQRALTLGLLPGADLASLDLASATVRATAAPFITATPESVPAGGTTTVDGSNFTPSSAVTVQLVDPDGDPIGDPVDGTSGADGAFAVPVPTDSLYVPGDYTLVATDEATGNTATAPLAITAAPVVEVNPGTVPAGGSTTVTGDGFAPESDVTVQLADADGAPVGDPVTVAADTDGSFSTDLPTQAGIPAGDYTVDCTDSTGAGASAPLMVTAAPSVAVDPGTVPAGGTTEVTGTGFTPESDVAVSVTDPDGNPVGDLITVTADVDGAFTTDLTTLAEWAQGDYTVTGTDVTSASASAELTVELSPSVVADPDTVPAGGATTIEGSGFTPGSVDVVLTDPDGAPVGGPISVTADEDGTFTLPLGTTADFAVGDYTVSATDGSGAVAETTLSVTTAPTLTADPGNVPAGGSTTVTGEGFTPESEVTLQLTDPDGNPAGEPVMVTTSETGAFTADVPTPADGAPGAYTVVATEQTGATAEAPLAVTVAPTVTVDPETVPAGGSTTATGAGFSSESDVAVQLTDLDGEPVGDPVTVTTDGAGAFTALVPTGAGLAPGAYTVIATDVTGADASTPLAVTVAPDLVVDPGMVPAGGTTTATGEGFAPGDATVQLVDPDGNPVGDPVDVVVDMTGAFGVPVPTGANAPPGDYTVLATDTTGASAEASLSITDAPSIVTDPGTVPAGGSTAVTGDGFSPDEGVVVRLTDSDGEPVGNPVTVTADETGAITAELPTPAGTVPGDFTVLATDVTGATATAPLNVTAAPTVAVDPDTVPAGGSTTVSGEGFTPESEVTVQLTDPDGNPAGEPVTVTTDADGAFETSLSTDGVDPATYDVVATDLSGASGSSPLAVTAIPVVTATPDAVPVGGTTTVDGTGFTPDSAVTVQLTDAAGTPTGEPVTVMADATGTIATPLQTPVDANPGAFNVVATDVTGAEAVAPLMITAAVMIVADPGTLPAGGTTTVTGSGFTPDSDVTVQLTDAGGDPVGDPVVGTVDPDGGFVTDLPVDTGTAPGMYMVEAADVTGVSAVAPLDVTAAPTIVVDPGTVPAGGSTLVTGEGFTPESEVTVELTDADGSPVAGPVAVVTDGAGAFTTDLPTPSDLDAGEYTVVATDATGATAAVTLVVTEPPVEPSLTVEPPAAEPGDEVVVGGDGFPPGVPVEVGLIDAEGEPVGEAVTVTPDLEGTFEVTVVVPAGVDPEADYRMAAVDPETGEVLAATAFDVLPAFVGPTPTPTPTPTPPGPGTGPGTGGQGDGAAGGAGAGPGGGYLASTGADLAVLAGIAVLFILVGVAARRARGRFLAPR